MLGLGEDRPELNETVALGERFQRRSLTGLEFFQSLAQAPLNLRRALPKPINSGSTTSFCATRE